MEHTHFVSAAALVTDESGRILLVKSPLRGWEYPGGMLEPGESLTEGLLREIKEESGVTAQILSYVGVCKNLDTDGVNHDFRCRYVSGTLAESTESTEVGWFTEEEALAVITNPLTQKRIRRMLSAAPGAACFSYHWNQDGTLLLHDDFSFPVQNP